VLSEALSSRVRANRRLPSATTLTSSPLESWTRLWLADSARLVAVSRGYLVAELQSRNSTTSFLEQAGETSGCLQRRGSADSKHRRSRHRRRLRSCEPSTVRGACEVVPVAHGRMLSDDFGRRRSAKDSGARSNLGSRIGWLANSISVGSGLIRLASAGRLRGSLTQAEVRSPEHFGATAVRNQAPVCVELRRWLAVGGNSQEFPGAPAQPLEEVAWEEGGGLDPTSFRLRYLIPRGKPPPVGLAAPSHRQKLGRLSTSVRRRSAARLRCVWNCVAG